jgi:hypothetical protein
LKRQIGDEHMFCARVHLINVRSVADDPNVVSPLAGHARATVLVDAVTCR